MAAITDSDVRRRREEIADQLGRHEAYAAMLRRELADLDIAIAVMERFHARPEYPAAPLVVDVNKTESTKPAGTPTVPRMILEAVEEALLAGRDGLKAEAITAWVRDRYWPDAPSSSIGPTAWRMAKDGRLGRENGLYMCRQLTRAASEEGRQDVPSA